MIVMEIRCSNNQLYKKSRVLWNKKKNPTDRPQKLSPSFKRKILWEVKNTAVSSKQIKTIDVLKEQSEDF